MRAVTFAVFAVFAAMSGGCEAARAPYAFRTPLVGAVSAPPAKRPTAAPGEPAIPVVFASPTLPALAIQGGSLTVAPAPTAETTAARELRGHVGKRIDNSSDVQFARDIARGLGAALPAPCSWRALAITHADPKTALLGDLLVFSQGGFQLVAVVVGRTAAGATEFIYLQRGVVKRGFVTAHRPRTARDSQGRILNTFVRTPKPEDSRRTRYRSGRLFVGVIGMDELTDEASPATITGNGPACKN